LARKKKRFNVAKEIKAIARERVGRVPAGGPIEPKRTRKKLKHKKQAGEDQG